MPYSADRLQSKKGYESPLVSSGFQATGFLPPLPPQLEQWLIGWLDGGWTGKSWISVTHYPLGAETSMIYHGVFIIVSSFALTPEISPAFINYQ